MSEHMLSFNDLSIPKTCYFYWDNQPMPFVCYLSMVTFKEFNPDYRIILFTSEDNALVYPNWDSNEQKHNFSDVFDYFPHAVMLADELRTVSNTIYKGYEKLHASQKADILRQWLMLNEGGIWSDFDILYISPLSKLQVKQSDDRIPKLSIVTDYGGMHASAFVFSQPGTEFYEQIWDKVTNITNSNYQSFGPMLLNTLYSNLNVIKDPYTVIDYDVIYPYPPIEEYVGGISINNFYINDAVLHPNILCIHWYLGSSFSFYCITHYKDLINNRSIFSKIVQKYLDYESVDMYSLF